MRRRPERLQEAGFAQPFGDKYALPSTRKQFMVQSSKVQTLLSTCARDTDRQPTHAPMAPLYMEGRQESDFYIC